MNGPDPDAAGLDAPEQKAPLLRVVRGEPSAEELAALVALVAARAATAAPARSVVPSVWRDRSRLVRPYLRPGPGAWRSAARPR